MISVVIPCYKVKNNILEVLSKIPEEIQNIYVIDDCCPENTGDFILKNCNDSRVTVLKHEVNKGVGGAVKTGYKKAIEDNNSIIIKIDGDGQMDPSLIPFFTSPLKNMTADYTKGNRFFSLHYLKGMPRLRLFGNTALSFINKIVSGYWNVMDPTNGYTAISVKTLKLLPLESIDNRYFFESDILYNLNLIKAVVLDIPMVAKYEDEESSMSISKILFQFPFKFFKRFIKRIFYNYFLRDFNIASVELVLGIIFLMFGTIFGSIEWYLKANTGQAASCGTVMLAALPVILGFQMLISFINYDIANIPKIAISQSQK